MKTLLRLASYVASAAVGLVFLGVIGIAGVYFYLAPELPSIEKLKDVQLQVPLRIYSRDGRLIAEYGEMKRTPLSYAEIPERMVQAVISAEDDRFFEHPGVDYQGILRAVIHLVRTGQKGQGGSTITMQVARNFFLSSEKTYTRKLREIFLALKIERELTKQEILELYLNKIYLGNRAYGVAAAAQVYYGKDVQDLTLAEMAMIAGLPKAPSRFNPVINPERAVLRRAYVVGRMLALGYIKDSELVEAAQAPVTARLHAQPVELEAPYVAEMVRAELVERYGDEAYNSGLSVYTTIDSAAQRAANRALRTALMDYDRRHGWRGAEQHVDVPLEAGIPEWEAIIDEQREVGGLRPGLVIALEEQAAHVYIGKERIVRIDWDGLKWAKRHIDVDTQGPEPVNAAAVVQPGDIIRLRQLDQAWVLAQVPEVAGALVSLRPRDGSLLALNGGFDFYSSKFNRAAQAERQPGSNFKPFVYSSALEKGYTAASIINDAPVVFEDAELESTWRPENYSGKFFGPTRLREALVRSRNLVSIRLLRSVGVGFAIGHLGRFGFDKSRLPRDLSLALGSATVTPLELARGYSVFANGGFLVQPYFIDRIEDIGGEPIFEADPAIACPQCEQPVQSGLVRVARTPAGLKGPPAPGEVMPFTPAPRTVSPENIYIMTTMMQDVVRRGTGRRALALGRNDLSGKTGTTNEQRDAWFSGFNGHVVTTAWVGFDTPRPLGHYETGARAALPMWVDYMRTALKGLSENSMPQPPGLVTVRIDPETGEYAHAGDPNAIFEIFRTDHVPEPTPVVRKSGPDGSSDDGSTVTEQLF